MNKNETPKGAKQREHHPNEKNKRETQEENEREE